MKKNRSWFTLVIFCAATVLAAALVFAALFASATLAFAVARTLKPLESSAAAQTDSASKASASGDAIFTGLVTDDICGAKHKDQAKNPSDCARMCVRNGAKYLLVNGDKTYSLEGDNAQLDQLAGQRASVVGTLDGRNIKVASVSSGQ
jgi:hypothetical protein